MRLFTKPLMPLCGFLVFLGCEDSHPDLLLNTDIIARTANETRSFIATSLLPDHVKYICSVGPYFDLVMVASDDKKSSEMLRQSNIFPVQEHQGYFIYFDENGQLIQHDALFDRKDVRWSSVTRDANEEVDGQCLDMEEAIIQIDWVDNQHHVGLKRR